MAHRSRIARRLRNDDMAADLRRAVRLLSQLMLDPDDDKAWAKATALVNACYLSLKPDQRCRWWEHFRTPTHEQDEPCTCSNGNGCSQVPVDEW